MRAFILVLDSLGIGGAPDAEDFGDIGANTLAHIAEICVPNLKLPNLVRLGLAEAARKSTGQAIPKLVPADEIQAACGHAIEQSRGKDTPSGHWEICGLPVPFDWHYFPNTHPCFPDDKIEQLINQCQLPGILGNKHASGTVIIEQLGEEHIHSGKPICYTSADSVLQIAAHEEIFGLTRLYEVCRIAKLLFDELSIGRVIARPFIGDRKENFARTANRRDYTTPPHGDTLLDVAKQQGRDVVALGKITDIFAGRGITHSVKGADNNEIFDRLLQETRAAKQGSLVFANFVDFDSHYGHRRDAAGYAAALKSFDQRLPEFESLLGEGDLALITADHGCDPLAPGSDHTREQVPILFFGPGILGHYLGASETFADMGQTIAHHLGLPALTHGRNLL